MANTSKTKAAYELEHKATGRKWSTDDPTEATNLRARGWTVKAEPKVPEVKGQQPDAGAGK